MDPGLRIGGGGGALVPLVIEGVLFDSSVVILEASSSTLGDSLPESSRFNLDSEMS